MPAQNPTIKMTDTRRTNKPIMEKRRRARINSCLNDLKALILEALKKDPSRHSKLEKADILEMTVKHLQNLHGQQASALTTTVPTTNKSVITNKFRAGFDECATEVQRYLSQMDELNPCIRQRLARHLSHCAKALHSLSWTRTDGPVPTNLPHLVPTRLPNGDVALLLPESYAFGSGIETHSMMDIGTPRPSLLTCEGPSLQTGICLGLTNTSCSSEDVTSSVPANSTLLSSNFTSVPDFLRPSETAVSLDKADHRREADKGPWRPW